MTFDVYGAPAQGYDGYWYPGVGGYGGETKATMPVVPGSPFEIVIGGSTGYNGGGAAGSPGGLPGAGATDVRIGTCAVTASCALSARILVAGGGGAAPNNFGGGGSGGGLTGQDGGGMNGGGTAGTQTAGGTGNLGGGDGSLGLGGSGAADGGGGGGGYYGGGGGGAADGGGGGSAYISSDPTLGITNASTITGVRSAGGYQYFPNYPDLDGLATISYTVGPPATLVLSPHSSTYQTQSTSQANLTATVQDANGTPFPGIPVVFEVTGANPGTQTITTDTNGQAVFTDSDTKAGVDTVSAFADTNNNGQQNPVSPATPPP